jgi:urea transport system substrate-binding protein
MNKLPFFLLFFMLLTLGVGIYLSVYFVTSTSTETIPVGILHSLTGTMGASEQNVVDATLLAIDEVNAQGGVLGKKIKPILFDGASDWPTFAKGAEKLITQDKVEVIFGCWTSASRKTILPVLEKYDHLLFYPLQYEGLEESPYVVYTGATANQQIIPGVVWAFHNLGKKFFLVGSDYVYPRSSHAINKEVIQALGGTVVGEEYIVLGSQEVDHIIKKIVETKPEVILNILVSESNVPFFKKLREAGITPEKVPTISFTFAELELKALDVKTMIGDYTALNYFQSIDRRENEHFVKAIKAKFGADRVVSDYMEAAYFGVHLWAQTANIAGTTEIKQIRKNIKNQAYNAPEGIVSIDQNNQHTWKIARIGKIQSNGQYNIVWTSEKTIQPIPYPTEYRSKEEWDKFLNDLYIGWGGKWSAN